MKIRTLFIAIFLTCFLRPADAQFSIDAGYLYVVQVGNGTETLTGTGNSMFIDQFSTAGSLANQLALPNTGASAFIMSGTSGTAQLNLTSAGGLILAGYNTPVGGGTTLSQVSGSTINRVIGTISAGGTFSIAVPGTFYTGNSGTAGNIRGAVTDGSGNYWTVGTGVSGSTGVRYYGTNSSPATIVTGSPRDIGIYGGSLYYSLAPGSGTRGIFSLGGTPTSAGSGTVALDTGGSSNPNDFIFNSDMTIAYVADGTAGIQRFDNDAGTWNLTYTLDNAQGFTGLAVDFNGSNPEIYATAADGSALFEITDIGVGSTANTIATAAANERYQGIVLAVPEPSTIACLGLGLLLIPASRRLFRL